MADIDSKLGNRIPTDFFKKFRDMGDGTYAEVMVIGGGSNGMPVSVYNVATNGDTFPADSATVYTYDASGMNITSITKTTFDGRVYLQTWVRDGSSQLSNRSGWVRQ